MLKACFHKQFKKDLKHCKKIGHNIELIKEVIELLISEKHLDKKFRLHKLAGVYVGRHECHIAPDWLLIFKLEKNIIIFERTGSHSNLFK
ncbi:MAG: Addiction module toxin, RelE/StbE family [Candidatus Falkowbacteria bacterium GW2011_GWC2_38_22]|uniref:Addiction module toxin, RelE/StbE family n=1 Tax=Candidatus Falkowbacteria bacterium GW2011_GWE1_38_31 TaxID=1618638 RepID=A0A0G0M936_9BACT|nr:MAG: Addiction module toxin, RelE/StbE family [Candidatus Falkowbacteria bacterium GW2011_GWF2_38_1205]KKQ61066.1 MAG: Addiction module toxin, RelE/StbE family [Candidatus Falkowbacteria bacterium GW2011_GWC2_38_22]KKQ63405.1 MAG: Addiction module toxin, RelE/StbE family [Candidatus Falkowbacteria bacterium GW2011_GWF1_38_22]KKQ65524.1 MAG: Addiction module toxin, RelE/StbE family [Candidatus Falkowbacteria bacterium GW2011_GWE2_38_254]KKQ70169.1 MAG: Addiction module toxin, RelE/StbE family